MDAKTLRTTFMLAALALVVANHPNTIRAQTSTGEPTAQNATATVAETVLHPADLSVRLPATVFFHGQTAPIQLRNSGGIRFPDGTYALFALVDSSGYSSSIREKYQAYLLTEVPLDIDGHHLAPGAYGCGFINPNSFVIMDIGGHDLFTAHASRDASLHRPTPLQVQAGDAPSHYRLYSGRTFVPFARASN